MLLGCPDVWGRGADGNWEVAWRAFLSQVSWQAATPSTRADRGGGVPGSVPPERSCHPDQRVALHQADSAPPPPPHPALDHLSKALQGFISVMADAALLSGMAARVG